MDARSRWAWGASLAFAAACALIYLELRAAPAPRTPPAEAPALTPPPAGPAALAPADPGVTNETLHAGLAEEREKMGIQAVGPQPENEAPEPFLRLGKPGSRAQAEEELRQIAILRKAIDRGAGRQDAVPIAGSVAPVLAEPETKEGSLVEPGAGASASPALAQPQK